MEHLFILFFVLVIVVIVLCRWTCIQREKIKELKRSVSILNKEHKLISKENIQLREFIKIQGLLIDGMEEM